MEFAMFSSEKVNEQNLISHANWILHIYCANDQTKQLAANNYAQYTFENKAHKNILLEQTHYICLDR